jgi:hypothetical protein
VPRYFFHVVDVFDITDDEGADLPDLPAARGRAIASARVLMCETLQQDGRITLHHRIDIEDDEHKVVGSVAFEDAIDILT